MGTAVGSARRMGILPAVRKLKIPLNALPAPSPSLRTELQNGLPSTDELADGSSDRIELTCDWALELVGAADVGAGLSKVQEPLVPHTIMIRLQAGK